jgi:hypothetical protein
LKNEKDRQAFQILHASMSWHIRAIREQFVLALLERVFRTGGSSRFYSHAIIENFFGRGDTFVFFSQINVMTIGWEECSEFFHEYSGLEKPGLPMLNSKIGSLSPMGMFKVQFSR